VYGARCRFSPKKYLGDIIMLTFTVHQLSNPPTCLGVLKGPFGVRIFYNKPAGLKAVDSLKKLLPLPERVQLKDRILESSLPERGETPEMEQLVAEALPSGYVM
jgi:hypothetical protein